MILVEMSIEEAKRKCKKNATVFVAEQDLERDDCNTEFVSVKRTEYNRMFDNVKTAASLCDEFMNQLRLFTEKQNIPEIEPRGTQKIVLIKNL